MIEGYKARVRFVRVTLLILTLLLSALFLFPYVFLALSSFKPAQEVITIPPTFFPKTFSIENYQEMYNYINVEKSLLNSFVSAFGSTAIAVLLGALSAFALVRANSKLSAILLAMVFFLKMIPLSAIAVPIYRIITSVGLYDTRIALVIVLAATNMPLVIWIMIGFFQSVPVSLDEAACVDGASSLATFFNHDDSLCIIHFLYSSYPNGTDISAPPVFQGLLFQGAGSKPLYNIFLGKYGQDNDGETEQEGSCRHWPKVDLIPQKEF